MRDIKGSPGYAHADEPVRKIFTQGMVIRNGTKMSKSKGNVVAADEVADKHGADTALHVRPSSPRRPSGRSTGPTPESRASTVFWAASTASPHEICRPRRVKAMAPGLDAKVLGKLHRTLKKITEDFDSRWHFNNLHRRHHGTGE